MDDMTEYWTRFWASLPPPLRKLKAQVILRPSPTQAEHIANSRLMRKRSR